MATVDPQTQELRRRQARAMDVLAGHVAAAQNQLTEIQDGITAIGRDGFGDGPLHGVANQYLRDITRALDGLERVVGRAGGMA